jgi:hypothetical protein
MRPRWRYKSENLAGNLHVAATYINEKHPEWDVVALEYNGGHHTVVVFRELIEEAPTDARSKSR